MAKKKVAAKSKVKSTNKIDIKKLTKTQKDFFDSGATKPLQFRIEKLKLLRKVLTDNEKRILDAIYTDLRKPEVENFSSELGMAIAEIDFFIKHLPSWIKPEKTKTPLAHLPGSSMIIREPYGNTLIIGPWNYPVQLLLMPLIGAIGAGNTAVLKPSEVTPHTSETITAIMNGAFPEEFFKCVPGGADVSQALLKEKWDYIFFTGGETVGKIVMTAAAKNLTPLTLELGGKSPCIVDVNVDLPVAARRIAWGKFFNAGQTCIAPDYVYVHKDMQFPLINELKKVIEEFFGSNPQLSPDLARIVNTRHLGRLSKLIDRKKLVFGGDINVAEKYLSPTVLQQVTWKDKIMHEEIFGPILPILTYENIDTAIAEINAHPKPLALYIFSKNRELQNKILYQTSSGGVCINDTLSHIVPAALPFGGVGASGMGAYHGRNSFETFSHRRSVLKRSFALDQKIRYAPYKISLKRIKKLIRFMSH